MNINSKKLVSWQSSNQKKHELKATGIMCMMTLDSILPSKALTMFTCVIRQTKGVLMDARWTATMMAQTGPVLESTLGYTINKRTSVKTPSDSHRQKHGSGSPSRVLG